MRTLIVHNPVSGTRSDDIFAFQRALMEPGDEVVMRTTSLGRMASSLVEDAQDFDAVVVSGGDGTAADVAYALSSVDVPLLVFPSGTANLLANNIGNAPEPAALARTLKTGMRVDIDMGEFTYTDADGQPKSCGFLSMAGCGYDADLMQGSAGLKQFFGQFSYYLAALGNLDPGTAHMSLVVDGERVEGDGICVLAGNWGVVNQTMQILPGSTPLDGLLDVALITARRGVDLIPTVIGSLLPRAQGDDLPNMRLFRCREVSVECDPAFPVQYDGEVVVGASTPIRVRVIPKGLHTIVDSFSPLAKIAGR